MLAALITLAIAVVLLGVSVVLTILSLRTLEAKVGILARRTRHLAQ